MLNKIKKAVLIYFPAACMIGVGIRSLDFMYQSLKWDLSLSLDASLMRTWAYFWKSGLWPYKDFETQNLPWTHIINLLGLALPGSLGFRILDVGWVLATSVVVFIYLRKYSLWGAACAGILIWTIPAVATPLGAFQRETMMLPLCVGALFCFDLAQDSNKKFIPFFVGAILITIAGLIKPTAFLLFAAIIPQLLRGNFIKHAIEAAIPSAAGLALTLIVTSLILMIGGALGDFATHWPQYFKMFSMTTERRGMGDLASHLFSFNPAHWNLPLNGGVQNPVDTGHLTLFHIFILGFAAWVYRTDFKKVLPLFILVLIGLIHYLIQQKGYQYHLYWTYCAINMLAALSLVRAVDTLSDDSAPARVKPALWAAVLMIPLTLFSASESSVRLYRGTGLYRGKVNEKTLAWQTPNALGKFVGNGETKGKRLLTLEIHSVALGSFIQYQMLPTSRYVEDMIFWIDSPYKEGARAGLLRDMQSMPPDVIAFSAGLNGAEAARLKTFPELETVIESNYTLSEIVREINGEEIRIYVRKPSR